MAEYKNFQKKRRVKQLMMAALFPAVLLGGWKYPFLGYFIPLCMLLGLGIAFYKGRKWCDWYCPRGSFLDIVLGPVSPKKTIPEFFKGLPFRIGVLSFLMLMMVWQIILRWPDLDGIGMFFVTMLTVTTVLGVILAFIFHPRAWCCFCPIGSLGNWVGTGKYPLLIDSRLCTECKLCGNVCPIQVAPFESKAQGQCSVEDGDCLKCGSCVAACPVKALTFSAPQTRRCGCKEFSKDKT